jgi:7-cyano-7-deazaguanine synthase in queuosine biosynthesis
VNRYSYRVSGERTRGRRRATSNTSQVLVERKNLFDGSDDLEKTFGPLTSMELDLLRLASGVFATDRASARGERENLTRSISLTIPVENLQFFVERSSSIEMLLHDLSQDVWHLSFVAREDSRADADDIAFPDANGTTLLFSGGLDSLAAAVEFSADPGSLLLVSHTTRNPVNNRAQKDLVALLQTHGRVFGHVQVFVSSRDTEEAQFVHDVEPSQRTRSLVFLTVGAICGRRRGHHKLLYMAENGQMAIHLPLTTGRIGAFSTKTAHPKVLLQAESLLGAALEFKLKIVNPYLYLTKAEVVRKILDTAPEAISLSTSCWKNARVVMSGATHCGECVPCLMRRIAIETYTTDPTSYARNILVESLSDMKPDDDGRRNLYDLAEFTFLLRSLDDDSVQMEYPELLTEIFDASAVVKMYRRFASEAAVVLGRYAGMTSLLR